MRKSLMPARYTVGGKVLRCVPFRFMLRDLLFLQQGDALHYQARSKSVTRVMNAEVADPSTFARTVERFVRPIERLRFSRLTVLRSGLSVQKHSLLTLGTGLFQPAQHLLNSSGQRDASRAP